MKLPPLLVMCALGFTFISPSVAQVGGLKGAVGDLKGGAKDPKDGADVALTGRVMQVVPEGLLFSMGSTTYLLVGHPEQKKLAERDPVNCYAVRVEKNYTYTDALGTSRTVRVYRYKSARLGKR